MPLRKLTALLTALVLGATMAGTALANHDTTVPGAVYGSGHAAPHQKIQESLTKAGVKDVPADNWAAGSLSVMVEAGLLKPDANGNLNPDAPVKADAGVAIFAKVLGIASKTDDDATAAAKAQQAGIIAGPASPDKDLTRLEVAKLIATALGIQPRPSTKVPFQDLDGVSFDDALLLGALYEAGIFKGFPDGTFQPGGVLTKAQIAILLDRILGVAGV